MARSFLRWNEFLDAVGEANQAHLVVVFDGGECQRGADLSGQLALQLNIATEEVRAAHIDQQHNGHLSLFAEEFDVGLAVAGADVPVDDADVVADLVFPHLLEFHTPAFERGVVLPREHVVDHVRGENLDAANLFE